MPAMSNPNQAIALLGHISPAQFLSEYWQKKPLLIRNAIANFKGLLSANDLAGLSCEEDVQARIILHDKAAKKNPWQVLNGPFDDDTFTNLPEHDWTLLVQSLNHHLAEAANLLAQFNFIPHARLDDLMVSYAPDGGGVGPHFDSYDVFLLQGIGQRLWRVSEQRDLSLVDHAPLKILSHFETEQEFILEAGDMLYLPPHVAHWGIAIGDCMTYSIGFRAPKAQELGFEFLGFMQDEIELSDIYKDPDLTVQAHPSEISSAMVEQVSTMLKAMTWDNNHVAEFLGVYLSEPKPDVVFEPPPAISLVKFTQQLEQKPILLALKSLMLCYQNQFFINGECIAVSQELLPFIQTLADERKLSLFSPNLIKNNLNSADLADLCKKLHQYYLAGYLTFKN